MCQCIYGQASVAGLEVACIRILQAPLTASSVSKIEMTGEMQRQEHMGDQGENKNS